MKVWIRLGCATETIVIENVSVDDKCFPLVAGIHPYSISARKTSPLALESSLWFKTLAVDAVFIDCNRRFVYWAPVLNDTVDSSDVVLRRSSSNSSTVDDFLPGIAQPLFEDNSLYDFDASLKEMMGKFIEATKKFSKRSLSTDEFNRVVAQLLHMYILPNIKFSSEDMYCLSRTRCLIEERLHKAECDIADKADNIDKLRKCLNTLKTNLLCNENLESERYLRTCKREFLKIFLNTTEAEIENLNLELEAEQSKVNWAKQHNEDAERLHHLQETRNKLFKDVEKLIRVREAIKNVISRREKTKKKLKKAQIVESCFHNVFVEINRRLEIEYQALNNLGDDKVNICAAREATMCAILELDNNNRNSDRATKFETVDFVNYSLGHDIKVPRPDMWLPFQERVSRILEDSKTAAFKTHKEGCQRLISRMDLALSEFGLTSSGGKRAARTYNSTAHGDVLSKYSLSTNNVTFRRNSEATPEKDDRRSAVLISEKNDSCTPHVFETQACAHKANTLGASKPQSHMETGISQSFDGSGVRALSTNDIRVIISANEKEADPEAWVFAGHPDEPALTKCMSLEYISKTKIPSATSDGEENDDIVELRKDRLTTLNRQRQVMTQQLALSTLMNAVESLKLQLQSHFREVTETLAQELSKTETYEGLEQEEQELLWRSYEQFFCKVALEKLIQIYSTGLSTGAQKAHAKIMETSLHEILKEDKLLDVFFGAASKSDRACSVPIPITKSADKISMAKTISALSLDVRHCDIKDLYSLANADGNDMRKRLRLDEMEDGDDVEIVMASSSGSSGEAELSYEEKMLTLSSEASSSNAESVGSVISVNRNSEINQEGQGSLHEEQKSRSSTTSSEATEIWKCLSNPDMVEQILDPVLTPFRKQVKKCLDAQCLLDKVRYITKATEDLNRNISRMIGPDFQSACDDIISMLILALCNMSEDVFVGLYVNLRILTDVFPPFLRGTLWDYNLVSLYAAYDYLFTLKVCESVVKHYPGSFKAKAGR